MNKYDERYIIRLAEYSEIDLVMAYINDNWKKGHIMATNKQLFEYEFREKDKLNIMIAIDRNTNQIEAMSGFLKASSQRNEILDIWGSIWKVNDNNMTFLGVEIVKRIQEVTNCRNYLGIGINTDTTAVIRKKMFHETIATMRHFYIINEKKDSFKIAVVRQNNNKNTEIQHNIWLKKIEDIESFPQNIIENRTCIPFKDKAYVKKRFVDHPIYKYDIWAVYEKKEEIALTITREERYDGAKALRIVDFYGSEHAIVGIADFFKQYIIDKDFEYVDFYEYGISDSVMRKSCFIERTAEDSNIIPNYFGPFVQRNIDIVVRYKNEGTLFLKADGDQDRPNLI